MEGREEKEGERERERAGGHINWLPPTHAPPGAGIKPATKIHALDGEQTFDPSVRGPMF